MAVVEKGKKMRLIDADRFKNWLMENYILYDGGRSLKDIDEQPTVDAEPVRHGHWVKKWNTFFKQDVWHCDVCENGSPLKYDYCPNCGAKMDRERKEDVVNK